MDGSAPRDDCCEARTDVSGKVCSKVCNKVRYKVRYKGVKLLLFSTCFFCFVTRYVTGLCNNL